MVPFGRRFNSVLPDPAAFFEETRDITRASGALAARRRGQGVLTAVSGSDTETEVGETEATGEAGPRSPRWRVAARLALAALLAAIVVVYRRYLAQSFRALGHLDWKWLALAVVAETVSHLAFAFSRRRLLLAGGRQPRRRAMIAITYAGNAVSMSLPFAGTGLATVYSYRQFRKRGIDAATTGWTLAVSGIFSTTSLALLLVAGAVTGGRPIAVVAGLAGAAAYLVPGAAVLLAVRYDRARKLLSQVLIRAVGGVSHRPARLGRATWLADFPARLEGFLDQIAGISLPRRGYAEVFGLAVVNWLTDCAALGFAVLATDQPVPWHGLLLAYCAGAAVGSTGITPGGFGLVELTLAATLTAGGLAGPGALAAVIAYRLVNFWLVILAGWAVILLLGDRPGTPAQPP
jgi:putative heme transporter